MKALELSVPARYFAQLFDHLEASGMPCRDVLSAAQVRTLNDPQARLTMVQVEALVTEAYRLTGRRDLGLELGKLVKLNSHDVLGYALISCPTIDHALRLTARYYRLMNPLFTMRYQRHPASAELLFQPLARMSDSLFGFYLEAMAVSYYCQVHTQTSGRMPLHDIYLSMPQPPHVARYRELRGARFHFGDGGQRALRIVFDPGMLDAPLAMTDLRALHHAEARCKQMMQDMEQAGDWSAWVEMMLRSAEDSQPTLDELAALLNISARTLDRHLARQDVGYRALALRIRNERACELLASGAAAISQIAYRLGYTDVANFSRSFKKQNGLTPSTYRAQLATAPRT